MKSTPPAKLRSREAARLESDYLERLHELLRPLPAADATEIEENVTGHIHEALSEFDGDEVGLAQMAAVLESLGPPETMIPDIPHEGRDPVREFPRASAETMEAIRGTRPSSPAPSAQDAPSTRDAPPAQSSPPTRPTPPTDGAEFLDRLFVGYLIVTIGLFIPVIEFYFCSIIGYAVILFNLRIAPVPEIPKSRKWAVTAILGAVAMCPAALLTLAEEVFGLLYLPVGIAWAVGDIALLWTIFGGLATWSEGKGMTDIGATFRNRRIFYIVTYLVMFVLAIPLGLIVAQNKGSVTSFLIGYALLPLAWVVNWFIILAPIRALRRGITSGSR